MRSVGGEDRASPDPLLISSGTGWTQGNNTHTRERVCTHTHIHTHTDCIYHPDETQQTQPGNRGLQVNFKVWDTGH